MDLGQMLKEKRNEHKLTQEQLAEKIFVSTKTISNWENNKTTPAIDSLIRLATLFHLSLDNLLLEGSKVVENIKKKAEIREAKIYLICTFITNLVFLFILALLPKFGELPTILNIVIMVGEFSNLLCILYFSRKYRKLVNGDWKYKSKVEKLRSILF